jgi:outer membrane protein assembly factor BamB
MLLGADVQRQGTIFRSGEVAVMVNWPIQRFEIGRSGFNPLETDIGPTNVMQLRQRWLTDVGGADWQASSPTVVGSTVFSAVTSLSSPPSDGALYAINDRSGRVAWRTTLSGSAREATPAVAGNTVLVSLSDASFTAGHLQAFNTADGRSRWTVPVGGGPSSAAVSDGVAYVATDRPTPAAYAIAVADGAVRWHVDLPGPVTGSTTAIADGAVFVVTELGEVIALETRDGSTRWRVPFSSGLVHRGPAVADGRVVVGDDHGHLGAYETGSGRAVWTTSIPAAETGLALALAYGRVYVATGSVGSGEPTLLCLDAATGGDPRWTALRDTGIAGPTVANGVVYVGDTVGHFYGFDAVTGRALWSSKAVFRDQTTNFDEIVIRDGALYSANVNGSNGYVIKLTLPFRPLAGWWWSRYRFRPQRIPIGDPPPREGRTLGASSRTAHR